MFSDVARAMSEDALLTVNEHLLSVAAEEPAVPRMDPHTLAAAAARAHAAIDGTELDIYIYTYTYINK